MKRFAYGIFMWAGYERQSRRYGFIYPTEEIYGGEKINGTQLKLPLNLEGKRVKLTVKVLETRQSTHAGDRFCVPPLFPSTPEIGATFEFVGIFRITKDPNSIAGSELGVAFGLEPSDGREDFWLDPVKLFQLHNQTVEFFIEETEEPDSPLTEVRDSDFDGAIDNGDGTFQFRANHNGKGTIKIKPNARKIDEGLYAIEGPQNRPGDRFEIV